MHLQQILTGSLRAEVNIFKSFNILSFKLRVLISILTPGISFVVALLTVKDLLKKKKSRSLLCYKLKATVITHVKMSFFYKH